MSSIDEFNDGPVYHTRPPRGIYAKHPHHALHSAVSLTQTEIFRVLARVSLFLCALIGCLIALWEPSPNAPPGWEGVTAKRIGRTWMENIVIAVRDAWPAGGAGALTFVLMCAGVVGALRVLVWACASAATGVMDLGERCETKGVRVGKWEDGQMVSGGEILAGMFG